VVGAAVVEVTVVFVLVAWSVRVSGRRDGCSLCVLLVFVVADAGVVLGLQAPGREGPDSGFAIIKRKMPKWHVKRAHHAAWPQPRHPPDYRVAAAN